MGCGRNEKKKEPLYILYIIYAGSDPLVLLHVVKKGKYTASHSKAHSVFRACESHCPTVLSHNDYLAQSVPNYIII